jgi:hypothetical protein
MISLEAAVCERVQRGIKVNLVCAADIEPEHINWLWREYLALEILHMLGGKPEAGKSTIALGFAAIVSNPAIKK